MENYKTYLAGYIDESLPENRVIFEALDFAVKLHSGQKRKSNEPYIIHPLSVAQILAQDLGVKDPHILASALLHDVVEDVPHITIDDIKQRFGSLVGELVDGCTKMALQRLDRPTLVDLTHSKLLLTSSRRLGILLIKMADRLHNIKTLEFLKKAKQRRIAQETIEIYAPLAAKLNLFSLKRELFQLALPYLYPKKSRKILNATREILKSPDVFEIQRTIRQALADFHCPFTIHPRAKSLSSYYSAVKRTLELSNTENQVDFTVTLETDSYLDCYTVLGMVANLFPPVPRTIRDFIATPRPNGYQSVHIRISINGKEFLVKIRTEEMATAARQGVLSKYDIKQPAGNRYTQEISELFRDIGEYGGSAHQRKDLIRLAESNEVFIVTPKGDVHYLPRGSIVLDFAYKIHSNLGDHCRGAIINDNRSPLTKRLKDGDKVEILTYPDPIDADPDLERLCKSPRAKSAVNRSLQRRRRDYAKEIGREILLQEINRIGLSATFLESEPILLFLEFKNIADLDLMYTRIGQDLLSPMEIFYYVGKPGTKIGLSSDHPATININDLIRGIHKFSNCCRPYPGQASVVAALSERGVAFHQKACRNLSTRHGLDSEKLLRVNWGFDSQWQTPLKFDVRIRGKSLADSIVLLSLIPKGLEILQVENTRNRRNLPDTLISLKLKDFREARDFFSCFKTASIVIKGYGRNLYRPQSTI
jgi:guanosine-3',5'-bis(diphosphate) 3'-pyrophosphohydrolase